MTTPATPPPNTTASGGANWGKIALFGCGGLLLLGVIVVVILGALYMIGRKAETGSSETTLYRSADHTFSGPRAENLVDFSFRYPVHWIVKEDESSDTPNFVTVENMTEDQFTIENFAVGYISGPLLEAGVLEELARQFKEQQAQTLPNFRWVMEGGTTVAGREGRYYTFTGTVETDEHGDLEYYGRAVLLPVTATQGVVLLAMATELSDARGPAEVGERGELAGVFDSFEIHGATAGASAAPAPSPAAQAYPGAEVLSPGTAFYSSRGRLEAGDPVRNDGTYYDAYQVYLDAGRSVTVTLESGDFDGYLTAVSPGGTTTDDDDGGGGTNARLELVTDQAGTWTFLANTLSAGESGAYELVLQAP